jgi:hypothetical protein
MNWTRLTIRAVLLFLAVLTVIYLNVINEKNIRRTAEFKVTQIERFMGDSLSARHKVDQLANEMKRFSGQIMEDSSHAREGLFYLTIMLILLAVSEIFFSIRARNLNRN